MNEDNKFSYTVGDIDEVVESRGNAVILLRKLAWGQGKEKLELRKWFVDIGKETPSKGVTFFSDEGPSNLVNVLIKHGYGETGSILKELSHREDFDQCLADMGKERPKGKASDIYYDPKEACNFDD